VPAWARRRLRWIQPVEVSLTDSPRNAVDSESSVGLALVAVLYFHYLGIMEQGGMGANVVAVPARYDDPLERRSLGDAPGRRCGAGESDVVRLGRRAAAVRAYRQAAEVPQCAEHPAGAMSIPDPDNPHRYLEVRGDVERVEPDSAASSYRRLGDRCSGDAAAGIEPPSDAPHRGEAPADALDRVVIVVRPPGFSKH